MIEFPRDLQDRIDDAVKAERERHEAESAKEFREKVERELDRLRVREAAQDAWNTEKAERDTPELQIGDAEEMEEYAEPDQPDLIAGVLKDHGTALFIGKSGSGKTTLALQAAHCLLTGTPFLEAGHRPGQEVQKIEGRVGVISHDMPLGLLLNWIKAYPESDRSRYRVVNAHARGYPLNVPLMRQKIVKDFRDKAVEVIVVDSFAASFPGDNQNDNDQVLKHYLDLQKFALTEVGARALIVIAHAGKGSQESARGASAHHDVADTVMAVTMDEEKPDKPRYLTMSKYRAGMGEYEMVPGTVTEPDDFTHLVRWAVEVEPEPGE